MSNDPRQPLVQFAPPFADQWLSVGGARYFRHRAAQGRIAIRRLGFSGGADYAFGVLFESEMADRDPPYALLLGSPVHAGGFFSAAKLRAEIWESVPGF
jgi:hypothetical protein